MPKTPLKNKTVCKICGRAWTKAPKRLVDGKTCCAKCAGIKGYLAGDRKETYIETLLYKLLEELGIGYTKQQPVAGLCVADAFVEPNYVFFMDGDYWHSKPKQILKDKKVAERLEKLGFVVLRYTETLVNQDISQIQKQVSKLFKK